MDMIKLRIKFTDKNLWYKKLFFPFILKPFLIKKLKREFLKGGITADFQSNASFSLIILKIRIIHTHEAIQKQKKFLGKLFTILTPDYFENKLVEPSIKKELIDKLSFELGKRNIYVSIIEDF